MYDLQSRKSRAMERNEREYGTEVRAKFGDAAMDAANEKLARLDAREQTSACRWKGALVEDFCG